MPLIDEQVSGPEDGKQKQSIEGTFRPLVKTPAEDFAVTLMSIADDFGVLDSAFGEEGVDDSFISIEDNQEGFTPSGPELDLLASKWKAIPRAERRGILSDMTKEDPQFTKQFLAAMKSTE